MGERQRNTSGLGMGQRLRVVRTPREGATDARRGPSRRYTQTATTLICCAFLADFSHFVTDHDQAWVWFLALSELRNAILCGLLAWLLWRNYPIRVMGIGASAWYVGQAIDEATLHNLWTDGTWENAFLFVYCALLYLFIRSHDSSRTKERQDKIIR